jgi:hypothetical protein
MWAFSAAVMTLFLTGALFMYEPAR